VAAATLGLAQVAPADDVGAGLARVGGEKPVVEKLLDILLASGQITRAQYDELLAQAREEQQAALAPPTPAVAAAPADTESGWKFKWSDGFKLEREDGAFKLKFGGRLHLDSASVWESRPLRQTIGGDGNGVEFRRARLVFEGSVYERLLFKAEYDFAQADDDDNPDFKDVYVGLADLGPVSELRAGHFKEPFLLEEWTSSNYITFLERGLNNVFFAGRNVGLMTSGNLADDRVLWQVGVFRDVNDQGFGFDGWEDGAWNVTSRVVGVPIYADEGRRVLHLGVSYSHQFRPDDDAVRYRQQPESHLAAYFADTRFDPDGAELDWFADGIDLANAELAAVLGPVSLQSEFTTSWAQGGSGNPTFWGTYVFASWFLTGENRSYNLGDGSFGRVKPRASFDPAQGDWGAFELAARYSYLDLNDQAIRGGEMWDVTGAINWYLYSNLRVMLNYVHSELANRAYAPGTLFLAGRGDVLQARVQVDF
jgi:phosphate-selective porin OprO/OprP